MSKKVLGRGLGAFFPDIEKEEDSAEPKNPYVEPKERVNTILEIPVGSIRKNPHQPRAEFDEFKLQELSDSIRLHGLIQPITVRHIGENRYELISGERRLRASIMAGMQTIPAYIRVANDQQSLTYALIENVQREELNAIEIALGYQRLLEECELTQEQVAEQIGKSRPAVANFLRLLQLPDYIQLALKRGQISNGHARSLITVKDAKVQEKLLQKAIEEDFSVRQLEDLVRKYSEPQKEKRKLLGKKEQQDILMRELTNRLSRKLSTKVDIKKKTQGGEIRIEYYSEEELDRLLSLFDEVSA